MTLVHWRMGAPHLGQVSIGVFTIWWQLPLVHSLLGTLNVK